MQAFIKDKKLIVNTQVLPNEKEKLLEFIEEAEKNGKIKSTTLYNIEGDKAGIQFEAKDKYDQLEVEPTTEIQQFSGLYDEVTVDAIQTLEVSPELDFSESDTIEIIPEENEYINKITITKPDNLVSENIKIGTTVEGIDGSCVELLGEEIEVTPITELQEIFPSENKNGITKVTVNAVTNIIDSNIQPENIKKDIPILGVVGTYEGNPKIVLPDGIKFGYSSMNNADFISLCDTNNITNISSMFQDCNRLTSLDVKIDGPVNSALGFCTRCSNLSSVNLSISNAISTVEIFRGSTVSEINLYAPKSSSSTRAFDGCNSLTTAYIDLSGATQVAASFRNCRNLVDLDIKIDSVTSISGLFQGCPNLSNMSLSNIINACVNMNNLPTVDRRLSTLGLSQDQANVCVNLPNWPTIQAKGWATGY